MELRVQETGIFKFDDIEVRPSERLLLKVGVPVAIEPKAFRVFQGRRVWVLFTMEERFISMRDRRRVRS
jgi:hypothetical protein